MESSAERAIEIGVNLFIFVIALSSAIILMTNVLNMSEIANDVIKDTSGSTLMELYGNTTERIYTGEQVLAIINEYNSDDTNKIKDRYILKIQNGIGAVTEDIVKKTYTKDSVNYTYNFTADELKSSYSIAFLGMDNDKRVYVFTKLN